MPNELVTALNPRIFDRANLGRFLQWPFGVVKLLDKSEHGTLINDIDERIAQITLVLARLDNLKGQDDGSYDKIDGEVDEIIHPFDDEIESGDKFSLCVSIWDVSDHEGCP